MRPTAQYESPSTHSDSAPTIQIQRRYAASITLVLQSGGEHNPATPPARKFNPALTSTSFQKNREVCMNHEQDEQSQWHRTGVRTNVSSHYHPHNSRRVERSALLGRIVDGRRRGSATTAGSVRHCERKEISGGDCQHDR